ncbi:MAG: M20 family metallopeptidase, partial [Pseudolabrys sp.]
MAAVDPVVLTQQLVRFNTINPPGQEDECIRFLADILAQHGFATTVYAFGSGRSNLIATLGDDPEVPGLCFTGHIDTVPLGEQRWQYDPFGGEIVDDRLYGRGSTDMKAGVAAIVATCCDDAVRTHDGRLSLVFTAGEETGCEGALALASSDACKPHSLLVVGEPTSNQPVIGHKGVAWYQAALKGKTAHGSMPHEGVNAADRGADFLRFLRSVDLGRPHEHLGPSTLNVGSFHAGSNINSVPDRAEIAIDCRIVPGVEAEALHRRISAGLGREDQVDVLLSLPPVWTDPADLRVQGVVNVCRHCTGLRGNWQVAPYFTDAAILQPA